MKLLASLVGFAACALVGPLFAQEESASPTSEETPSTSVEAVQESPAPTPSPAIETKPSASPATTAAQTTPTKKMSPAAEAKASPAGKKMSGPAALKDSENRWAAALGKHDVATVEAMVATDFVGVNPKGKVQNRRGLINEMKGDKDNYTSNKNEKMDAHMFGPNVGVVVGTYREKGSGKDGKAFDRTYRYTDTWMERGGNWQCIASQVSLVAQK